MKKHVLASMIAVTSIGFFSPLTSHAFGLGKIEVMSALNEPFKAEIAVNALRPEERDNLQVKMASDEEFSKAGLNRSFLLSQMQFDIVQRDGRDVILVTSKQAIKEPFLDFLIAATAGSGLMLREYTVLLDPPKYVMAETRAATTQAVAPSAPVESKPTTTSYQYAQGSGFSGSSYDVQRNDTLWNVAMDTRPDSAVSVHQMMMALLKANPDAFTNQNVNGLKAGVTLKIPSRAEIEALSKSAARNAFADQNTAWANRNQPAVTTVAELETTEETSTADSAVAAEQEAAESVETAPSEEATAAGTVTADSDARLQLVAPEDDAISEDDASPNVEGNDKLQSLTEQLTLAQETIEAQTQENIDFKARMDAMEEQLETMRRLISLKDADLARLQSLLEEEDPALAAEVAATLESNEMATAEAEQTALAEGQDVATDPAVEADTLDEQAEVEPATPAEEPEPEQAEASEDGIISSAAGALDLDQQQVQSTVDKVKQFVAENKIPAAVGLLLLLLVLWLIARRNKREVTWEEAVQKLDKDDAESEFSSSAVVTPMRGDDISDAPLSDTRAEEKSVAELVEQADMFVGYADYVQARSSLEQARNQEPGNSLVAYKLLFVLYKQNQADEFVALTQETAFDKDSFEWEEIKQWGQELAPTHELFSDEEAEELEDTLEASEYDSEPSTEDETEFTAEADETAQAEDNNIEFDLNDFADATATQTEMAEEDVPAEPKKDIDDDLLSFDTNFTVNEEKEADDSAESESLDINVTEDQQDDALSIDELSPVSADDVSADEDAYNLESESKDASPDLQFDIGDLDDLDEAETKLDLASAYIDMGDPDGARSILKEVIAEGNDDQKGRAQDLLSSLS